MGYANLNQLDAVFIVKTHENSFRKFQFSQEHYYRLYQDTFKYPCHRKFVEKTKGMRFLPLR